MYRANPGEKAVQMTLNVAFQMDPIGSINIDADSSFRLAEEAQARGHSLFYYTPDRLAYQEGRITARGWPLTVRRVKGDHFELGKEQQVDLSSFDVVWLRQDPPLTWATSRPRISLICFATPLWW